MKTLVKIDRNGSKHYIEDECPRCHGTGRYGTFGTCFKCNGTGKYETKIVEHTPEYEAKLKEKRDKKAEQKHQEIIDKAPETNKKYFKSMGFDEEGNAYIVLGNTYPIKDELKAAGARFNPNLGWYFGKKQYDYPTEMIKKDDFMSELADLGIYIMSEIKARDLVKKIQDEYKKATTKPSNSHWVGEIGEKIDKELKLKSAYTFISSFTGDPFGIYKFVDEYDNVYVWKTTTKSDLEEDTMYQIKGTIKDHSEYKDEKQTILTRCKYTKK